MEFIPIPAFSEKDLDGESFIQLLSSVSLQPYSFRHETVKSGIFNEIQYHPCG